MKQWTVSDISHPLNVFGTKEPILAFQDNKGEYHDFYIIVTDKKVVFGGVTNVGLIESGYIDREGGETLDETLQELLEDLETYYNDGPRYTTRIVCNERM